TNTTPGSGQSGSPTATNVCPTGNNSGAPCNGVPGTIYNSESGLITGPTGATVGLADFGTRLKAVFNNVPAGVRIFVTTTNVANDFTGPIPQPAGNSTTSFAALVLSETAPSSNVAGTGLGNTTVTFSSGNVSLFEV